MTRRTTPPNPANRAATNRVGAQHPSSTPQPTSTQPPHSPTTSVPENAAPAPRPDTPTTTRPLPPGWRWARLGDVAEYINGRAFKPSEWEKAGLPIIRIENLTSADALCNYYTGTVDARHLVRDGDLLISWSASLDAFMWDRGDAVLNQHIFKVVENRDVADRDYLYMVAKHVMTDIRSKIHGGTMQHITKPLFEAVRIPLPPLPEQRRIAAVLRGQFDAVRRAREAALARLEAARALPAAFLRSVFESEEAQSWPRVKLGEITRLYAGTTPPRGNAAYYGGTVPWVKTTELVDGTIVDTDEHVTEAALSDTSLRLHPVGTLLVGMIGQGQTRGRTALLSVPGTNNQNSCAILPGDGLDTRFLQLWFRHNYSALREDSESRGGGQPALNVELMKGIIAPLPPMKLQEDVAHAYAASASGFEAARQLAEVGLTAIDALPQSLLRQAFAGEL